MTAIGIDVGTTNSCVAIWRNGRIDVLPSFEGGFVTPSVVAVTEAGETIVGEPAKASAELNRTHTYRAVKRLIGRRFDDPAVETIATMSAFGIVEADNGEAWIEGRQRPMSPQEISGLVLRRVKQAAERAIGKPVTQAVITVPAYFNNAQRQATREAGKIAGLEVLRIINEPTAAAIAEDLSGADDRTVAVFDLGGGTFDISILRAVDGEWEVLATNGDTFLGGEDYDARIVDYWAEGFLRSNGVDLRLDKVARQRLRDAAEKAKVMLSSVDVAEVPLDYIANPGSPLHFKAQLSRATLEELTSDLTKRAVEICRMALADAELTPVDIDELILVGGMTRMPAVYSAAQEYFAKSALQAPDPDQIVAKGAARMAAVLTGELALELADVTPFALGIETADGYAVLIEAQSRIPARVTRPCTTAADLQGAVTVRVRQGLSEAAKENRPIAEFHLTGLRPGKAGEPRIDVTAEVDADGTVTAGAYDRSTGRRNSRTVEEIGLSPKAIERIAKGARNMGAAV